MHVKDIRPFVPAKDYQKSRSFYSALGFDIEDAGPELSILTKDGFTFFLYNDCDEVRAENVMLQLVVSDLDDVLDLISSLEGIALKHSPIKQERWGKVIYLWGPGGELWHVTQLNN